VQQTRSRSLHDWPNSAMGSAGAEVVPRRPKGCSISPTIPAEWVASLAKYRHVAYEIIGTATVSTIFVGTPHFISGYRPCCSRRWSSRRWRDPRSMPLLDLGVGGALAPCLTGSVVRIFWIKDAGRTASASTTTGSPNIAATPPSTMSACQ
jgi:hypothetical protein